MFYPGENVMRRLSRLALVACLLMSCNTTQERASEGASGVAVTDEQRKAVEDTIRKLVEASAELQNKGQAQLMRRWYAPSAISIQDGQIIRDIDGMFAQYDSMMKTAGGAVPKLTTNVERIDVLAPSAAVVTATSNGSIDSAGKELKWGHVYSGVWQNRDGKWELVVEHATPVAGDTTAEK
jgi:ketosteroid isomerase-like protein